MNNVSNGHYTHQYPGMAAPWPDRQALHGQDSSILYNPSQDVPLHLQGSHHNHSHQSFPYPHPISHQHGPPTQAQIQNAPFYQTPHRQGNGARRFHSHSHYQGQHHQQPQHSHNPHGQPNQHYPYHGRTHPPVHVSHTHTHPSNLHDDFAFTQGMQNPQRFDRSYDMMGNNPQQQFQHHHGVDYTSQHGVGNDIQNVSHIYPGAGGHSQTSSPGDGPINSSRHQYTQKGSYDTNWGPGSGAGSAHSQGLDAPSMPFNPMHQQQTVSDSVWSKQGGKKLFNYLPMGAPSNYHPHQPSFNPNLPLQAIPVSGYSTQGIAMGVSGTGTSGQYDVDRRPPKSAELFDPDGPQQHTGSLGPQYSNNRHQSFSDNFDGSASDRQLQGFNGSSQPQAQFSRHSSNQSQQSHHSYQHHQQQQPSGHSSQLGFSSVSMTRSYSSSSSGTGNTSSPAPQASKKNSSLLYDYSTPTPSYEASVKCTPEAEKPSPLSHILEIYDFNASDNIYDDLVLPAGSKLRRTKASSKDGVNAVPTAGQSLVVFKTAALATEAMAAFQEGRESWMGSDSKLTFDDHDDKEGKDGVSSLKDTDSNMGSSCTRIQLRFNIRVWTPVLVNSLIPVGSGAALASMAPSPSSATASTHPSSLTSGDMDTSAEDTGAGISDPEKEA